MTILEQQLVKDAKLQLHLDKPTWENIPQSAPIAPAQAGLVHEIYLQMRGKTKLYLDNDLHAAVILLIFSILLTNKFDVSCVHGVNV